MFNYQISLKPYQFFFSFLFLALFLTGCANSTESSLSNALANSTHTDDVSDQSNAMDSGSSSATDFEWSSCYQVYECGMLSVPLNYENPGGELIEISLIRITASKSSSLGPLLVNFGGPGVSGTEMVNLYGSLWEFAFPEFDVIGFDPRGVGLSTQVNCPNDLDDDRDWTFEDGEDVSNLFKEARLHVKKCLEMSGELALHVGTNNVARDMDQIRLALGRANHISWLFLWNKNRSCLRFSFPGPCPSDDSRWRCCS